jgi:ribosomal protein S18 acetylase RimI-like enzyme
MGYLRKANLKDLNHVCENMREMDRLEAVYQTGEEPADALRLTYLAGEQVLTIAGDNDQPMGLCGVISDGCIWMICTDELFTNKKYKIQLIRKGRKWVESLLKKYKILYNFVYAENDSAIKWLKSLGFTFIQYHEHYGMQGKPFYEFLRIA